jgi:hypothetical protein
MRPTHPKHATVPLAGATTIFVVLLLPVKVYPFGTFYALSAQSVLIGPLATDSAPRGPRPRWRYRA